MALLIWPLEFQWLEDTLLEANDDWPRSN
jgi:hypothetical protein